MGNSCTREEAVALSETGIRPTRLSRNAEAAMQRGRWSAIGYEGSVDLDALLEAPSPAVLARRRKRGKSQSERIQRTLSRESEAVSVGTASSDRAAPSSASSRNKPKRAPGSWFRSAKSTSALDDAHPQERDEEEESTYHSYDDPGYLSTDTDRDLELTTMDSDLILASPPESPTVIHARWGEPVDDPDEEGVCTEFKPNPFKLGFCINCQKQHDVNANGDVESTKEYKKITRPTIAKYAANALDNPAAVLNITPRSQDADDVDLGELLKQRRDILAKLGQLQKDKAGHPECDCDEDSDDMKHPDYAARHTMFLADTNGTNLANLRRMAAAGGAQAPQSLRVQRAASARSERAPASFCGVTKSLSLGNAMLREDSEEPVCNDWL